mgnify:CR=1 FL=1
MQQLITPREAAQLIGVSVTTIKEWIHRAEAPIPSVTVGKSGRFVKVIASEIDTWLITEAARKSGAIRESA